MIVDKLVRLGKKVLEKHVVFLRGENNPLVWKTFLFIFPPTAKTIYLEFRLHVPGNLHAYS